MNMNENIYTVSDIADKLKLSRKTIYNYMRAGRLKGKKIGEFWYFTEKDIQDFFNTATTERKPALKRSGD